MEFDKLPISEKIGKIEQVVKEKILPMLAFDGGYAQVLDVREGEDGTTLIYLRYGGACAACSMAGGATLFAIEETLKRELGSDKIKVVMV